MPTLTVSNTALKSNRSKTVGFDLSKLMRISLITFNKTVSVLLVSVRHRMSRLRGTETLARC